MERGEGMAYLPSYNLYFNAGPAVDYLVPNNMSERQRLDEEISQRAGELRKRGIEKRKKNRITGHRSPGGAPLVVKEGTSAKSSPSPQLAPSSVDATWSTAMGTLGEKTNVGTHVVVNNTQPQNLPQERHSQQFQELLGLSQDVDRLSEESFAGYTKERFELLTKTPFLTSFEHPIRNDIQMQSPKPLTSLYPSLHNLQPETEASVEKSTHLFAKGADKDSLSPEHNNHHFSTHQELSYAQNSSPVEEDLAMEIDESEIFHYTPRAAPACYESRKFSIIIEPVIAPPGNSVARSPSADAWSIPETTKRKSGGQDVAASGVSDTAMQTRPLPRFPDLEPVSTKQLEEHADVMVTSKERNNERQSLNHPQEAPDSVKQASSSRPKQPQVLRQANHTVEANDSPSAEDNAQDVAMLVERMKGDPYMAGIMNRVAGGTASAVQLAEFQAVVDEITKLRMMPQQREDQAVTISTVRNVQAGKSFPSVQLSSAVASGYSQPHPWESNNYTKRANNTTTAIHYNANLPRPPANTTRRSSQYQNQTSQSITGLAAHEAPSGPTGQSIMNHGQSANPGSSAVHQPIAGSVSHRVPMASDTTHWEKYLDPGPIENQNLRPASNAHPYISIYTNSGHPNSQFIQRATRLSDSSEANKAKSPNVFPGPHQTQLPSKAETGKRKYGQFIDLTADDSPEDIPAPVLRLPPGRSQIMIDADRVNIAESSIWPSSATTAQVGPRNFSRAGATNTPGKHGDYQKARTQYNQPHHLALDTSVIVQQPYATATSSNQTVNNNNLYATFPGVIKPIDSASALERSAYDPSTIARDILIATGFHPYETGLNAHLTGLVHNFSAVNARSDLATFRWDLVDPGGEPVPLAPRYKSRLQTVVMPPALPRTPQELPIHPSYQDVNRNAGRPVPVVPTKVTPAQSNSLRTMATPSNLQSLGQSSAPSASRFAVVVSSGKSVSQVGTLQGGTNLSTTGFSTSSRAAPSRTPNDSQLQAGPSLPHLSSLTATGKKRGRPFKTDASAMQAALKSSPSLSTGPKKRGRPFKDPDSTARDSPSASTGPKKRGRPFKVPASLIQYPMKEPQFLIFKCEWEDCPAELHNLQTLRVHLCTIHGKEDTTGQRTCLWGICGPHEHDDPDNGEAYMFGNYADWREHIEEAHLKPLSQCVGEGPKDQLIAYSASPDHITTPWLNDADGNQVIQSIEGQEIEGGKATINNEKRFEKVRRGIHIILEPVKNPEAYKVVRDTT